MLGRVISCIAIFALAAHSVHGVKWYLKNPAGKTCILLNATEVKGTITYENATTNSTSTFTFTINDPAKNETLVPTGSCNVNGGSFIKVPFYPNGVTVPATEAQPWSLTIYFNGTEGSSFRVTNYFLETTPAKYDIPTQNYTKASFAEDNIEAAGTNAFKCSTTTLALTSESTSSVIRHESTITFSQLNLIAEALLEKEEFPNSQIYELCQLDSRTSDVVPIVVGACLAGLVVIVLIAYLIGRARARRQGYASV